MAVQNADPNGWVLWGGPSVSWGNSYSKLVL